MGNGVRWSEDELRDHLSKKKGVNVAGLPTEKKNKYRNTPKVAHGKEFQSTKEANRYFDLFNQQMAGQITKLETQKSYELEVNGIHICDYVADFFYIRDGAEVIEDVKSKVTRKHPVYRLKKMLMQACRGIWIEER